MPMPNLIRVEPREGYRVWTEYDDGASGEVNFSDLAGDGVFEVWLDREFFEQARVSEFGTLAWGDDLEICPHATYFRLTGKKPEEMMSGLRGQVVDV